MKKLSQLFLFFTLLILSFSLVSCDNNQFTSETTSNFSDTKSVISETSSSSDSSEIASLKEKLNSLQEEINALRQENQEQRNALVKLSKGNSASQTTSVYSDNTALYNSPSESSENTTFNSQKYLNTNQSDVEAKIYWLNTGSNVRHNSSCRYYHNTKRGRPCTKSEGRPCGKCGG